MNQRRLIKAAAIAVMLSTGLGACAANSAARSPSNVGLTDNALAKMIRDNDDGKGSLVLAFMKVGYGKGGQLSGYQGWLRLPTADREQEVIEGWMTSGKLLWAIVPTGNYVLGDLYRNGYRYRMRKRGPESIRVPIKKKNRVYYVGAYAMLETQTSFDLAPVEGPSEAELLGELLPALAGTRYEKDVQRRIKQLEAEN